MEKRMKKMMGLIIVVLMISSQLVFAVGGKEPGAPVEISWMTQVNSEPEDNIILKEVEERFDVKINLIYKGLYDTEKYNMLLASGDAPDAWQVKGGLTGPLKLYNDGLTRSIPKADIQKYVPEYAEFLDNRLGAWKMGVEPGKKNSYIALWGCDDGQAGIFHNPAYRLDWLENVGIKPHGKLVQLDKAGRLFYTNEPCTVDELEQIFTAFTYNDPDQNGKDDTFGMAASVGGWYYSWLSVMNSFGISPGRNRDVNGEAVPWEIDPEMKNFLILMNKWYEKGLIDPEFVTNTYAKMHEKLIGSKAGYWVLHRDYAGYEGDFPNQYFPKGAMENDPKCKVLIAPPEKGKYGSVSFKYRTINNLNYAYVISKNVDDELLPKILSIYRWTNWNKEGYMFVRFGVEGVNYKWEGEPLNSHIIPITDRNENTRIGLNSIYQSVWPLDIFMMRASLIVKQLMAITTSDQALETTKLSDNYRYDLFGETLLAEYTTKDGAGLNTIRDEFMTKAITGQVNINAEWDGYVATWMKAGGDRILGELQKAPTVSEITGQ